MAAFGFTFTSLLLVQDTPDDPLANLGVAFLPYAVPPTDKSFIFECFLRLLACFFTTMNVSFSTPQHSTPPYIHNLQTARVTKMRPLKLGQNDPPNSILCSQVQNFSWRSGPLRGREHTKELGQRIKQKQ